MKYIIYNIYKYNNLYSKFKKRFGIFKYQQSSIEFFKKLISSRLLFIVIINLNSTLNGRRE